MFFKPRVMNLSYTLIENISKNLKFNTSFVVEEDRKYNINLIKFINLLSQAIETEIVQYRTIYKYENTPIKNFVLDQDFVIMYVVTITFSRSNTMIHISDTIGNIKWFCSSGSINVTGKQKKQRRSIVLKLILLLFQKAKFIFKKPVALHLNNVGFHQAFILNKLKKEIYIKVIKSFTKIPYNGCRKKKIRRKKFSKIFK